MVGSASDIGVPVTNQSVPLNQYMLRLADVYLIYAEASIGSGSSTSDAKALNYFNAVRTRAGLDARTGSITYNQVFNERRVEFGIEGINWLDVKRRFYRSSSDAISYINSQARGSVYQTPDGYSGERNDPDVYVLEPPTTAVSVTSDDFYLPIPSTEVTANPLLAPEEESVDWSPAE